MVSSEASSTPYFYFYIPTIRKIGVCLPFSYFEAEVLIVLNMAPFQIAPNSWTLIWTFEIICRRLGSHPTIRIFFSFYGIKVFVCRGWITLAAFLGRDLFNPHSNHFKG